MRRLVTLSIVVMLAATAVSCGGSLSMPEYAERVEALVVEMNDRLDELDIEYMTTPDIDEVREYARERFEARERMVEGLEDLDPPPSVEDLHAEALRIMTLVASAEEDLVRRVEGSDRFISVGALWNTPEGLAAREAVQQAVVLCDAAQASFDRTRSAVEFEDVPWIPPAMKDVIDVAFGCHFEDRER